MAAPRVGEGHPGAAPAVCRGWPPVSADASGGWSASPPGGGRQAPAPRSPPAYPGEGQRADRPRRVTIKALPQCIVSLAPSNPGRLFAVGAWHAVVGVITVATYPPEVATVRKVGGFVPKSLSIETIVSLKPGLVLAAGELQRLTIEARERIDLTVVAIEDPQWL